MGKLLSVRSLRRLSIVTMNKELKAIIDSTCDLPPMPLVASRIVSLASDLNTDSKILERAILADQALTAKILKIANSSFYGCIRAINTVAAAIVLIGFKGIKTLALAASLESFYRRMDLTEKMLWEHSVGAAIAAHLLSKKLHCYAEEAFVGGLMHDIGKVILHTQLNEAFSEIVQVVLVAEAELDPQILNGSWIFAIFTSRQPHPSNRCRISLAPRW